MDSNILTDFESEELFLEWLCKSEPFELHCGKEITQTMGDTFDCFPPQNSISGVHYDPSVNSSMEKDLISQLPPPPNLNLEFQDFDDFDWVEQYFSANYDSSGIINLPPLQEAKPTLIQQEFNDYCNGNNFTGDSWSENLSKTEVESVGSSGTRTSDEDAKRKGSRRSKSVEIELEEIKKHFNVPITKAAREMKVGLTVLKKRCRDLNIKRWPHRKMKSLSSLIENVKELGLTRELEMLEEHRRLMEKLPEVELTEDTKKLRQACFKAKYKNRRSSLDAVLA
ncbi:protein RKD4-like isoform X2 [Macadamia integrifolia]|uniref:protein RKD4-like isoform X2 n=1 Tax=Macadamia integrifolia TaxID=60698 RepID=UPI001C5325FF|nr:protein RKD4-like isoform X2 [Macadamia integrifolia]